MKHQGALSRAMIDHALPLPTDESERVAKETYARYLVDVLGYSSSQLKTINQPKRKNPWLSVFRALVRK